MERREFLSMLSGLSLGLATGLTATKVFAADRVKVGVFPSSSALPYYVALKRGYFAEVGIEVETVTLNTHPLIVQSMITGAIDATSNLVTLEGANINAKRPDTLRFMSVNGQNAKFIVEQFVVKASSRATKLTDLKGTKLFSAPGPANIGAARAVLKAVGLVEGTDFTIQEQQVGTHLGALQTGNFDGGYTLEPIASLMIRNGVGKRLEAGVISTHLLGNPAAEAYAAGGALSGTMLKEKPDLAKRYAAAWAKAVKDCNTDPKARDLLAADMNVPADLTSSIPLANFVMVKDLTAAQIEDFQNFLDIGTALGVVSGKVDAKAMVTAV